MNVSQESMFDIPAEPNHPAKYTTVLLLTMAKMLQGRTRILDPFGGTGKVFLLNHWLPDAQRTVAERHYLKTAVDPRARAMCYFIRHSGYPFRLGCIILGIPHATRCGGWWGYPGLPTQWQVVDLSRIYIDPELQAGGSRCAPGAVPGFTDRRGIWRPAVASWAIHEVLARVQRDRVALWPPVYIDEPYHIRLAISYHDPLHHTGAIYRAARALPMYRDKCGQPVAGSSGKFGWCWMLDEPEWGWAELDGIRPRTMRLI